MGWFIHVYFMVFSSKCPREIVIPCRFFLPRSARCPARLGHGFRLCGQRRNKVIIVEGGSTLLTKGPPTWRVISAARGGAHAESQPSRRPRPICLGCCVKFSILLHVHSISISVLRGSDRPPKARRAPGILRGELEEIRAAAGVLQVYAYQTSPEPRSKCS